MAYLLAMYRARYFILLRHASLDGKHGGWDMAATFTPSISLYVTCTTEDEVNRLFEKLSQGGNVLMPLAAYPFSKKFGWVADKYGVSWQLNLERD